MGLIEFSEEKPQKHNCDARAIFQRTESGSVACVGNPYDTLQESMPTLRHGDVVNFWTFGRYTLYDIVGSILKQIGAADVQRCTTSTAITSTKYSTNGNRTIRQDQRGNH